MSDEPDDVEITRRQFGAAAGSITFAPAIIGSDGDGVVTPLADALPDERIEHGSEANPSWHVHLSSSDDVESIESWVDNSDKRSILRKHDRLDVVTVIAPEDHIGLSYWARAFDTGLQAKSYVERIDLNISMSNAEPIAKLADDSAWEFDTDPGVETALTLSRSSLPESDGIAFDEDASETPNADALANLGADTVDVDTSGLRIGVVDTGVTDGSIFQYEDADGNTQTRLLDASKNIRTGETGIDAVVDGNDHGSWVASAMAADRDDDLAGFLPDAEVLAIKALSDDGDGSTEDITAAVEYAVDQGCDVICLSLGSPFYSETLDAALEDAVEQGPIPVVAAGNDRFGSTFVNSPADSDHTIAVHATNVAPAEDRLAAYFANPGPDDGVLNQSDGETTGAVPQFAAPGMQMTTIVPSPTGSQAERTLSGTSMSAPYVGGAVGLVLASEGALEFDDLVDRLGRTATRLPNLADNEAEFGAPDVEAAIADDETEDSQSDVMTDEADERALAHEEYSNARGGRIVKARNGLLF